MAENGGLNEGAPVEQGGADMDMDSNGSAEVPEEAEEAQDEEPMKEEPQAEPDAVLEEVKNEVKQEDKQEPEGEAVQHNGDQVQVQSSLELSDNQYFLDRSCD